MDLFIQYGVAAGIQAFRDSGLEVTESKMLAVLVLPSVQASVVWV